MLPRPLARALVRLRQEAPLVAGMATLAVFATAPAALPAFPYARLLLFAWLFAAILLCVFRVVHHAERLADRYGEPYGSMILTFSLLSIEVSLIATMMLTGNPEPTLARDTMFAGIMLTMNGVVGVVLLAGGIQHGQQEYNLEGARAYLAALIPLAVIGLVLPNFTGEGSGALSVSQALTISVATIVFYVIFLSVQTMRHRSFFIESAAAASGPEAEDDAAYESGLLRPLFHFTVLLVGLGLIFALAGRLAIFVDHGVHRFGLPVAAGGALIAILTLTPECVAAFRDALKDKLQHSVNVFLGGALATIGLTVPCVLIVSALSGQPVTLGLKGSDMVLLLLTLFVSSLTFGGVRTNVLQGAVHLLIFALYVILIFDP